ncbi:MAG: hypothetical protein JWO05_1119 [Gemmatimonadetes bacterium]|nr:hypothetical protein [Gemmatimonadota bacterium]
MASTVMPLVAPDAPERLRLFGRAGEHGGWAGKELAEIPTAVLESAHRSFTYRLAVVASPGLRGLCHGIEQVLATRAIAAGSGSGVPIEDPMSWVVLAKRCEALYAHPMLNAGKDDDDVQKARKAQLHRKADERIRGTLSPADLKRELDYISAKLELGV